MCRGAEGLTPRAAELVVDILGDIRTALAEQYGCDPDEIVIGPVDIGPDTGSHHPVTRTAPAR